MERVKKNGFLIGSIVQGVCLIGVSLGFILSGSDDITPVIWDTAWLSLVIAVIQLIFVKSYVEEGIDSSARIAGAFMNVFIGISCMALVVYSQGLFNYFVSLFIINSAVVSLFCSDEYEKDGGFFMNNIIVSVIGIVSGLYLITDPFHLFSGDNAFLIYIAVISFYLLLLGMKEIYFGLNIKMDTRRSGK